MTFDQKDYTTVDELVERLDKKRNNRAGFISKEEIFKITQPYNNHSEPTDQFDEKIEYLPNDGELVLIESFVRSIPESLPARLNSYICVFLSTDPNQSNFSLLEGRLYYRNDSANIREVLDAIRNAIGSDKDVAYTRVKIYGKFQYNKKGGSPILEIHGIEYHGLLRFLRNEKVNYPGGLYL